MFKTTARSSALIVTLTFLALPASRMQAQSAPAAQPSAVTGGDPQPTGGTAPKPHAVAVPTVVLATLALLGLA